jgi:hypothetical protein
MTDTELRLQGMIALARALGSVEAERFVAIIQREPFDYTRWRQHQWNDMSIEGISSQAMALRKQESEPPHAPEPAAGPVGNEKSSPPAR